MRTRSVQLVTSWWVVCVWAAVSLATGLVSVVAVLQPAWYVRYSQIHAQDVQGVAYQVMVSSVGPLGYCRLEGVKQVPVAEEASRPGHVKYPTVSIANTIPTLSTSPFPSSTTTSEHPLHTPNQDPISTSSPLAATKDPLTPEEVRSTTLPPRVVQDSSPTANSDVSGEISVTSNERSPSEATNTIITVANENSDPVEANRSSDTPLTTAESFSGDGPSEAELQNIFKVKEPTSVTRITGTPIEESNAPRIDVATHSTRKEAVMEEEKEEEDDGVRSGRKGKGRMIRPGTSADGRSEGRKNTTAVTRGRRKKGKHRRRKKKYNRKRPRPREGGKTIGRSRGPPRPDTPLHHLLRSRLEDQTAPLASPLRQPRQQKLLANTDYRPRPPILSCSGIGGGVGSGSSAVWALVGVLYGVAGVVQVVVGVGSLAMHLSYAHARKYTFATWLGNAQVAVVMCQGVALVLFPLGLGSPLARGECGGSSSVYWPGECSFGWSYMLGVVATTLAAYCPCLARLTVFRKYDYKEWDSINFF